MPTLLEQTQALLANRRASLKAISEASGVGLHWLRKFAAGTYPHSPKVETVQQLHDYLAKRAARKAGR